MPEIAVYRSMAAPASLDDLKRLKRRVFTHLEVMEEESLNLPLIQVEVAREVARVLGTLVDGADGLSPDQRALVRGAIAYFLETEDVVDDVSSAHGMEDDRRVVNALCHELARPDLVIPTM